MGYEVLLDPRAAKALKKLDEATKARIKKALLELAGDPYRFGEQMHPSNFWKIKQEDYRVIYEINKEQKQIIVLYFGDRKNVYDDFANLLY